MLTGIDEGTMKYTASIIDAGYEIERVIFDKVAITATTKIYTNTDFENGIKLEVDIDGDGSIDKTILPTKVLEGTDIEAEYDDLEETYSNYGLISKNNRISMSLTGNNLTINSNILSNGTINVIGNNCEVGGVVDAGTYLLNGKKQEVTQNSFDENLETELQSYLEENIDLSATIPNSRTIGKTCFVTDITDHMGVNNNLILSAYKLNNINPYIIYSKEGNITITSKEMNFNGILYAPNGNVTISGSDIKFNGIIIANRIIINGKEVELKNDLDLTSFKTE